MHSFFKGKIFGCCKSDLRSKKTLYYRIVCQIQEHDNMVGSTAFLKGTAEKFSYVIFYAHCCKYNGKVFIGVASQRSLLYDLRSKFVVGKSVSGKNRKFLSADQCCQTVDSRNTCVDIVSRVLSGYWIQRKSIDIQFYFRGNIAQSVNRLTDSVKGTSEDFRRKSDLHWMSGQSCMSVCQGHAFSSLKDLNNSLVLVNFYNTADLLCSVVHMKFYDFFIGRVFNPFQNNQRAVYLA